MRNTRTIAIIAILSALVLSSCANTIRGIGRDVNETADAISDSIS
ncbi:MAG: entericidin EcnAB [Brucellaceae bacterium]|nr:entericidin EcnAB [Brucellaceae bacterium]